MQNDFLFQNSERLSEAGGEKHLLTKTFSDCGMFCSVLAPAIFSVLRKQNLKKDVKDVCVYITNQKNMKSLYGYIFLAILQFS